MELTSGLKLMTVPQPILRRKAQPISVITPEIKMLAEKMVVAMNEFKGVGLAAPQINHSLRLMVITDHQGGATPMINPQITFSSKEKILSEEGCLSVPGVFGTVKRAAKIRYKYQTLDGKKMIGKAKNFDAIIMQHEIDHLDGVLFLDKAEQIIEGRDQLDQLLSI